MSEQLQTRGEHSRSVEDAEFYKAIRTLTDLGLLIPLSEIETYHGRAADINEHGGWSVDPNFRNGDNDSGNSNLNKRPTLYTGTKKIALEFAQKRSNRSEDLIGQIHQIHSKDEDATILSDSFNPSALSTEDREKYFKALDILSERTPISEGSPLDFKDRDAIEPFIETINRRGTDYGLTADAITKIASDLGIEEKTVLQLASAHNSFLMSRNDPRFLVRTLLKHKTDIFDWTPDKSNEDRIYPLNLEYVQRFLRNAHIVGIEQNVISATLKRDNVMQIALFDLDKVDTKEAIQEKRADTWKRLGSIVGNLKELRDSSASFKNELMKRLSDLHAKPHQLVEAAKKVEGFDEIFNSDTGVWEEYTLEEHTETVLRNFDENYADKIPAELIAPMRLAIIVHDIGKPMSVQKDMKHLQKEFNIMFANKFLGKLGVDKKLKNVILAMIGAGSELAYKIFIKKEGDSTKKSMKELATKTMKEFTGSENVSMEQIASFITMCKMLQVCDGGEYTSMAITRKPNGSGSYRNYPSFNGSFRNPISPGKRDIVIN